MVPIAALFLTSVATAGIVGGASNPAAPARAVPPSAELQQGGWTQALPLELPPGPGGLVPGIGITLDPRVSDGPLGPGWRLDGFSRIERRSPTGGVSVGESDDTYWADGAQLYDAPDGMAIEYDDGRVFTEAADEWSWTATRDGWTWTYGTFEMHASGTSACTSCSSMMASAWLLTEVRDPWGNTVTITYSSPAADISTSKVPATVSYGPHTITLGWEPREHVYFSGRSGVLRADPERLSTLEIDDDATYTFAYATDTDEVASVTKDGRTLRTVERVVQSEDYPADELALEDGSWPTDYPDMAAQLANFDGDGLPDLLRIGDGVLEVIEDVAYGGSSDVPDSLAGVESHLSWDQHNFAFVDLNRDGWTDVMVLLGDDTMEVSLSTGDGDYDVQAPVAFPTLADPAEADNILTVGQFADLDGDGYPEFIDTSGGYVQAYRNLGMSPWFSTDELVEVDLTLPTSGYACGEEWEQAYPPSEIIGDTSSCDFLPDDGCASHCPPLVVDPEGNTACMLACDDAAAARYSACLEDHADLETGFDYSTVDGFRYSQLRFGDYNGDGLADVAYAADECWTDGTLLAAGHCDTNTDASSGQACPVLASEVSATLFGDGRGGFTDVGYDAGPAFLTQAYTALAADDTSGYRQSYENRYGPSAWPSWDAFGSVDLHGEGHPGLVNSTYGDARAATLYYRRDLGLGQGWVAQAEAGSDDVLDADDVTGELERLPGFAFALGQAPYSTQILADVDGDGLPDLLRDDGDVGPPVYPAPWSGPEHRITGVVGPWGGTTELTWTTSALAGDNPILTAVVPVIESVTDENGTTSYTFSGGSVDGEHNRDSGFADALAVFENGYRRAWRFSTAPGDLGHLIYELGIRPNATIEDFHYHRYTTADLAWWQLQIEPHFVAETRVCDVAVGNGRSTSSGYAQSVTVEAMINDCEGYDGHAGFDPHRLFAGEGWTRAYQVEGVPADWTDAVWHHGSETTSFASFALTFTPPFGSLATALPDTEGVPDGWPVPGTPSWSEADGAPETDTWMFVRDTTWDGDHRVDEVRDHRSIDAPDDDVTTRFTYDSWDGTNEGKALLSVETDDAFGMEATTEFSDFAAFGQPKQVTQRGRGGMSSRTWHTTFDTHGDLASKTDPMSGTESWTRDSCGSALTHTDAAGRITSMSYDSACRMLTRSFENANEVWTYDAIGRPATYTRSVDATGSTIPTPQDVTTTWLRDDAFLATTVGDGFYPRAVELTGADWTDSAGLDHHARAHVVALDRWGRSAEETDCLVDGEPTSIDDVACVAGSDVSVTRAWAADGSLRMVSDGWSDGEVAPTHWTWRDGAGRVVVQDDPAPVDPATPDWVRSTAQYGLGRVETVDPMGQDCVTTFDTRESDTSCDGTYRGGSQWDALGRVTRTWNGAHDATVIELDGYGRVQDTWLDHDVDLYGSGPGRPRTFYGYDDLDRLTSIQDAEGHVHQTSFDAIGRPLSASVDTQTLTTWAYADLGGVPTEMETDADGNATITSFDGFGRALYAVRADRTASSTWGVDGNVVETTTVDGVGTTPTSVSMWLRHDALGRVVESVGPDGDQSVFYDGAGRLTGSLDDDGVETGTAYAWNGAPLESWQGETTTGLWTWRDDGLPASVTAGGTEVDYSYDGLGRKTQACVGVDGATCGVQLQYGYDSNDRMTSFQRGGDPATEVERNALGWVTRLRHPDSSVVETQYDQLGRPRARTDEEGATSSWSYDTLGRLSSADAPGAGATTYSYTFGTNEHHVVTQPDGGQWDLWYDALGHVVELQRPDDTSVIRTYRGDLLDEEEETDEVGTPVARTVYAYDDGGRVTQTWGPQEDLVDLGDYTFAYTYSGAGRLLSMVDPGGSTTTWTYDDGFVATDSADGVGTRTYDRDVWGRPETETWTAGTETRTTDRAWSADGLGVSDEWVDDGAHTVHRAYSDRDAFGLARSASVDLDGVTEAWTNYTTDTRGRLTQVVSAVPGWNGTVQVGYYRNGYVQTVDANLNGGPTMGLRYERSGVDFSLSTVKNGGGTVLASVSSRDGMGRPTGLSVGAASVSLAYDAMGRMTDESVVDGTSSGERSWVYDARGRVIEQDDVGTSLGAHTTTYAYAEPGWLTDEARDGVPTATYAYDAAGNRVQKDSTASTYGSGNRLTAVDGDAVAWNGFGEVTTDHRGWTIAHGPDGAETALVEGGETRASIVRDAEDRPVTVETDEHTVHTVYGLGDEPIAEWQETRGAWLDVRVDGLKVGELGNWGMFPKISDPSDNGLHPGMAWEEKPESFGVGSDGGELGDRNYGGLQALQGTPYQLAVHRLYDPETGRFAKADPLGLGGGPNRYAYVGNQPVGLVDPAGLAAESASHGFVDPNPGPIGFPDDASAGGTTDPLPTAGPMGGATRCGLTMSCGKGGGESDDAESETDATGSEPEGDPEDPEKITESWSEWLLRTFRVGKITLAGATTGADTSADAETSSGAGGSSSDDRPTHRRSNGGGGGGVDLSTIEDAAAKGDPYAMMAKIALDRLDQERAPNQAARSEPGGWMTSWSAENWSVHVQRPTLRTRLNARLESKRAACRNGLCRAVLGWAEFHSDAVPTTPTEVVATVGVVGGTTKFFTEAKESKAVVNLESTAADVAVVEDVAGECVGPACSTGGCFSAGTAVEGELGTEPIERVEPGERVWAEDPETGVRWLAVVGARIVHQSPTWRLDYTLADGGEAEVITTAEHPFWREGRTAWGGRWVAASDLEPGDVLRGVDGPAVVLAVAPTGEHETVYNLTIPDAHDYRVGDGGLLVHNADPADCTGGVGGGASEGLARFDGPKPTYHVNNAHVPGRGLRPGKTPLPSDAEAVFKNAVPNDPVNPTAWFGKNADGQIYRFSAGNDGTAHFSGIDGVGDGVRNLTDYARMRLDGG